MACLRKKGSKFYIKDYVDGKEKWLKTGTSDLKSAELQLKEHELLKLQGLRNQSERPTSWTAA